MNPLIGIFIQFLFFQTTLAFIFSPSTLPFHRKSIFFANKVDNIVIEGNLAPLHNNILVQVKSAKATTSGGIYLPDNAREKPTEGQAIATGPGRVHLDSGALIPNSINVGDSVIYGKYDGVELKYNDHPHQMVKDEDIILKFQGTEATIDNVECVDDHILIKISPKEEKKASGLIVATPETNKNKQSDSGVVAKVGPGRVLGNGKVHPVPVKPGDGVRFRDYAGTKLKLSGEEYIVVRTYDVLAKW